MSKILLTMFLGFIGATLLYLVDHELGFITVLIGQYHIDVRSSFAIVSALFFLLLYHSAIKLITHIYHAPQKIWHYWYERKIQNNHTLLETGVCQYLIGDTINSYKNFSKLSNETEISQALQKLTKSSSDVKKIHALHFNEPLLQQLRQKFLLDALSNKDIEQAQYEATLWFQNFPSTISAKVLLNTIEKTKNWNVLLTIPNAAKYIPAHIWQKHMLKYIATLYDTKQYSLADEVLSTLAIDSTQLYYAILIKITLTQYNEALNLLQKYWWQHGNVDIATLSFRLLEGVSAERYYKLAKKLYNHNLATSIMLIKAALSYEKYHEAGQLIAEYIDDNPSVYIYLLMLELCQRTHANPLEMHTWLQRAMQHINERSNQDQ